MQETNAGDYTVKLSNTSGSVTSMVATLTIVTLPVITGEPASQTVECSSNAVFTVTADGTAPLSYQWYFAGGPIAGATAATLTIPNAHATQAGSYSVTVSNAAGSAPSTTATLTVVDTTAPTISCPASVTLCTSSNSARATFTATATDSCDAAPMVTCTPASGSDFPLGTTTVTCTAVDSGNNTNTCAFTVTVFKAAQPTVTNVSRSGNTVTFSFPTENGCTYRVEYTDSLNPIAWTLLTTIAGDGSVQPVTDPTATGNMRFYRIAVP